MQPVVLADPLNACAPLRNADSIGRHAFEIGSFISERVASCICLCVDGDVTEGN